MGFVEERMLRLRGVTRLPIGAQVSGVSFELVICFAKTFVGNLL